MPTTAHLVATAQEALMLAVAVSLPIIGVAALAGLIVALFQAATQVQDFTLAHLPRVVVVAIVLAWTGPWMGSQIASFATRVFSGG
jgi:flagellar biosynthetic protein FliQ